MSYTLSQELSAYCEILVIAEDEIEHLLFCDHPPQDIYAIISQKSTVVEDLKWLIRDIKVKIASDKFDKLHI